MVKGMNGENQVCHVVGLWLLSVTFSSQSRPVHGSHQPPATNKLDRQLAPRIRQVRLVQFGSVRAIEARCRGIQIGVG